LTTTSPELLAGGAKSAVFLILPQLIIIERMSRLSNFGVIFGSIQGTMVFSVSGGVKVETKFTNDPEETTGLAPLMTLNPNKHANIV
jgi:hypothetical protein